MIAVRSLARSYGGRQVLSNVDPSLPADGIIGLVGTNGAGKSTLLSVMAKPLGVDTGTVEVGGLNVATTPGRQLATILSVLKQGNHLAVRLIVHDLMRFGHYPHDWGHPTKRDETIVDRALEQMDLIELTDRYLDEMSGGRHQQAFVAMVLAQETPYILLDEPLNDLDMVHSVAMMCRLCTAAHELERTVVVVMHDIDMVAAWSDQIVAVRKGRVILQGTPEGTMTQECLSEIFDMGVSVHEIDGRHIVLIWS